MISNIPGFIQAPGFSSGLLLETPRLGVDQRVKQRNYFARSLPTKMKLLLVPFASVTAQTPYSGQLVLHDERAIHLHRFCHVEIVG